MRPAPESQTSAASRKTTFVAGSCILLVLGIYIWTASTGTGDLRRTRTVWYSQLASSFVQGELALELKPDPALLALTNPYTPKNRAGIPAPLDVSLYGGKFYLYFGPLPALLLIVPSALLASPIGDQYLVLPSICGIFLLESALLLRLRRRFFPDLAPWILGASLLFVGLVAPFTAILKAAAVYEAATTTGQFFFLAGFYCALDALDRKPTSTWKLVLTGLLWSAALASRITLILPIGFMAAWVAFAVILNGARASPPSTSLSLLVAFGLPLALGLAALSWYNWARFGSVFETGFSYQLGGPLMRHRDEWYSPAYVLQNIYNYGFNKPGVLGEFPYLAFVDGQVRPVRPFITLSKIYSSEKVAGILYAAPFLIFAIMPAFAAFTRDSSGRTVADAKSALKWVTAALYGSFLLSWSFFLVFFWSAERYKIDFLPPLLILSVMGFWQLIRRFNDKSALGRVCSAFGMCLLGISIVVSSLLTLGTAALR